jgi:5-methylcytosine-specific restriction protein A
VEAGTQYCPKHKKQYAHRDSSHYGYRWRKIRTVYLAKNPICADCQKNNKLTPANEVHHVVSVADGGTDRDDNLMALCKSCHSKRTAEENRFGW